MSREIKIIAFATQGGGGNDEVRLRSLFGTRAVDFFSFDVRDKVGSVIRLLKRIGRERPSLIVMEGTGIFGGMAVLISRFVWKIPYVVSSGDAVGPFIRGRYPGLGYLFTLYEKMLCRFSSGFIGWTPYLVGRALTFGAPTGLTLPGWAPSAPPVFEESVRWKKDIRTKFGIPNDATVIGMVGSLDWNPVRKYCYGYELVEALKIVRQEDVYALIVGDGSGRKRLEALIPPHLRGRILLAGKVPRGDVPKFLAAMDVGSLPQSRDGVGNFRYTTKLSEYMNANLPVVTGRLPVAYDLGLGWMTRLPGRCPWDKIYIRHLSEFLDRLKLEELDVARKRLNDTNSLFSSDDQQRKFAEFIEDVLSELGHYE